MLYNTEISTGVAGAALGVEGPQPVWLTLNQARERAFTGEIVFETDPEVFAYLDNGIVYYAERVSDASLGRRLLDAGLVDVAQLDRGTVCVGDVEHLGRLFDRDTSVDRDAVIVMAETATEELIAELANRSVATVRATAYRHHPSGVHRWFVVQTEPAPLTRPVSTVAQFDSTVIDGLPSLPFADGDGAELIIEWDVELGQATELRADVFDLSLDFTEESIEESEEPSVDDRTGAAPDDETSVSTVDDPSIDTVGDSQVETIEPEIDNLDDLVIESGDDLLDESGDDLLDESGDDLVIESGDDLVIEFGDDPGAQSFDDPQTEIVDDLDIEPIDELYLETIEDLDVDILDDLYVETVGELHESETADEYEFTVVWPDGSEERAIPSAASSEEPTTTVDEHSEATEEPSEDAEALYRRSSDGHLEFTMPPLALSDEPEQADADVPDDVADAVRRAIAAIEAAGTADADHIVDWAPQAPLAAEPQPDRGVFAPPTMETRAEVLYGLVDAEHVETESTWPEAVTDAGPAPVLVQPAADPQWPADDAADEGSGGDARTSALRRLIGSLRRKDH